MPGMGVSDADLAAAEERFQRALRTGDLGGLEILGYGEISTVVAISTDHGRFACKRLPPFDSRQRLETYAALFGDYLERLGDAGLNVLPSRLRTLEQDGGRWIAYCIQPVLEPSLLGPAILGGCGPEEAPAILEPLFEHVFRAVSPRVGLDGQLSNWARVDGEWTYLDVTTPLLRDADGRDRLDAGVFLAMLPSVLRGLVKRFLLHAITATYFDPRTVAFDFLGNLHKERLAAHVPAGVEIVNRRLSPPISVREVGAYYARDARLWAWLLWLRRADRWWQLRVRRRVYPFLLPGRIER
jgi:Family of unknown function (DUF6206)